MFRVVNARCRKGSMLYAHTSAFRNIEDEGNVGPGRFLLNILSIYRVCVRGRECLRWRNDSPIHSFPPITVCSKMTAKLIHVQKKNYIKKPTDTIGRYMEIITRLLQPKLLIKLKSLS